MDAVWAVGLMTGTVLDGNVDVALLRTDGERVAEFGPAELRPYPPETMPVLREALAAAGRWAFEGPEPPIFREAERMLTAAQAQAVTAFLAEHGIARAEIAVVGFHGQSVLHRAPAPGRLGATRQLGDGEAMARQLGIAVAYDFRAADVEAGGQGAPLAPVYHRALLRHIGAGAETAVLNLGGVANITALDEAGGLHAFDTGPANAPLNDWMLRHTGAAMDQDGETAARGTVDEERLGRLLEHPYLRASYPKSLDRNSFTAAMAEGLSLEDGAATLTAFTAGAVARALQLLPLRPQRLVVSGGGRHNPVLMHELDRRTGLEIRDADELGLRGDAVEAECFALLAVRTLRGLPLSFPTTTGVPRPLRGGRIAHL